MKKLLALVFVSLFALGVVGCGDPCTKTADMMTKCVKGSKSKDDEKGKKEFIKACKKSDKMKKALKKCSDITDCDKFKKCFAKVSF